MPYWYYVVLQQNYNLQMHLNCYVIMALKHAAFLTNIVSDSILKFSPGAFCFIVLDIMIAEIKRWGTPLNIILTPSFNISQNRFLSMLNGMLWCFQLSS